MNTIDTLPKTTFSGRRFTRKQLSMVQDTVETFKNLSRRELSLTICELLNWKSPNGKLKINSSLALLEALESHGIVTLPAKRKKQSSPRPTPCFDTPPDTQPINGSLESLGPITLKQITSKEDRNLWKAYLHAYHYLGYKHPFGAYIGYFAQSKSRILGCLLFSASAAWALAPRDQLIGWEKKHRQKLLHLILSNGRFLIFPWVKVPNLASKVLSLSTKQVAYDWLRTYGYKPVLIETFVDTQHYSGGCYRAANWHFIGKTKGRGFDPRHISNKSKKDIYLFPLEADFKNTLMRLNRTSILHKKYRNDLQSSRTRMVDNGFLALWEKVAQIIKHVAEQYDGKWQKRKRIINSMLIILLIFRLVCSKNAQSYGTTIDELWDSCHRLDLPLPQTQSIAPSSFCQARKKLDETAFKEINDRIIETYAPAQSDPYRWLGHRIFAIDGSKINLPRPLLSHGYKLPSATSYYPHGLISCLYQLNSKIPYDFDLVPRLDERALAHRHLKVLRQNDVVIYDRGYFSYALFHHHINAKIHAVFRLQESSFNVIDDFFASHEQDLVTTLYPSRPTRGEIHKKYPDIEIEPLSIRLIKYQIGEKIYCLGTTLLDQSQYGSIWDFIDIYHARWGVEELYKISKCIFNIEEFHAKSERGVKQEIFAHFAMITMSRIFSNQAGVDLNPLNIPFESISNEKPRDVYKINFKNCVHIFTRNIEELVFLHAKMAQTVQRVYRLIVGRYQKDRPYRSFDRKSMKPRPRWTYKKKTPHGPPKLVGM